MKTKPRMNTSTFASIFLTGAMAATAAWAQQSPKEPVQVSGADLQAWLSNGFVYAAEEHTNGSVFFVVGGASERTMYFFQPGGHTRGVKGTQRVVGDSLCGKWLFGTGEEEKCPEWYRVGENKYEAREKGSHTGLHQVVVYLECRPCRPADNHAEDRRLRALGISLGNFDDQCEGASLSTGPFLDLARPAGFEPTTPWFVGATSIH
jgi:hypothetical protein